MHVVTVRQIPYYNKELRVIYTRLYSSVLLSHKDKDFNMVDQTAHYLSPLHSRFLWKELKLKLWCSAFNRMRLVCGPAATQFYRYENVNSIKQLTYNGDSLTIARTWPSSAHPSHVLVQYWIKHDPLKHPLAQGTEVFNHWFVKWSSCQEASSVTLLQSARTQMVPDVKLKGQHHHVYSTFVSDFALQMWPKKSCDFTSRLW